MPHLQIPQGNCWIWSFGMKIIEQTIEFHPKFHKMLLTTLISGHKSSPNFLPRFHCWNYFPSLSQALHSKLITRGIPKFDRVAIEWYWWVAWQVRNLTVDTSDLSRQNRLDSSIYSKLFSWYIRSYDWRHLLENGSNWRFPVWLGNFGHRCCRKYRFEINEDNWNSMTAMIDSFLAGSSYFLSGSLFENSWWNSVSLWYYQAIELQYTEKAPRRHRNIERRWFLCSNDPSWQSMWSWEWTHSVTRRSGEVCQRTQDGIYWNFGLDWIPRHRNVLRYHKVHLCSEAKNRTKEKEEEEETFLETGYFSSERLRVGMHLAKIRNLNGWLI